MKKVFLSSILFLATSSICFAASTQVHDEEFKYMARIISMFPPTDSPQVAVKKWKEEFKTECKDFFHDKKLEDIQCTAEKTPFKTIQKVTLNLDPDDQFSHSLFFDVEPHAFPEKTMDRMLSLFPYKVVSRKIIPEASIPGESNITIEVPQMKNGDIYFWEGTYLIHLKKDHSIPFIGMDWNSSELEYLQD